MSHGPSGDGRTDGIGHCSPALQNVVLAAGTTRLILTWVLTHSRSSGILPERMNSPSILNHFMG